MHHHIHHTEGIILSHRARGEANKMLSIYTLEHGLINAAAQGIRLNKSKLRFSLQDLSYAKIDLVRGRDIWRVTSATPINSFSIAQSNIDSLALMLRVSKLLERLCSGEEGNKDVYVDVLQSFFILDNEEVSTETREALELHLVLRILNRLGYIGDNKDLTSYLNGGFEQDMAKDVLFNKRSIVLAINQALRESQL
ncbi:MAG: repair protein RecO [Patescibacteria group bacterium]|nr:repair protein RecO [Patescibacteria group bacterium]